METILKLALTLSALHPADPEVLWEKFSQIIKDIPYIKNAKRRSGRIFFEVSDADFKRLREALVILSKELSAGGKSAHFDLYPRDLPGHKMTILPSN